MIQQIRKRGGFDAVLGGTAGMLPVDWHRQQIDVQGSSKKRDAKVFALGSGAILSPV
jgi:hypothetical protein